MANIDGTWDLVVMSPIGRQELTLDLVADGSAVRGTGTTPAERLAVEDGVLDGDTLTFSLPLTKPLPLRVVYTLTFDGDEITGKAKAGAFPAAKTTGRRA